MIKRAKRIIAARKAMDLTQAQLADMVSRLIGDEVARSRIRDIEAGKSKNLLLVALAEMALGISDVPVRDEGLPPDEQELLAAYRRAGSAQRERLMGAARDFALLAQQSEALAKHAIKGLGRTATAGGDEALDTGPVYPAAVKKARERNGDDGNGCQNCTP